MRDENSMAGVKGQMISDLFSTQLTNSDDESTETPHASQDVRAYNTHSVPPMFENPPMTTSFDSAVDNLSSLVWKMSIGPGGQPSFTGPSGHFAALDDHEETEPGSQIHSIATRHAHFNLDDADTQECLIGLFMDHINPYYQFLDDLSMFMSERSSPTRDFSTDFRTNAVLAAGACYASSEEAAILGQAYTIRADDMMLRCCRENPNLALVQGLAILTWRELSLGHEHTAWVYDCESLAGRQL
jgi:hypothetical protein